jgi:hypothetical protein
MKPIVFERLSLYLARTFALLLFSIYWCNSLNAQSLWSDDPRQNNPVVTLTGSDQFAPAIAKDGLGGAIITWVDNRSGNPDIFAMRIDAAGALVWSQDGDTVAIDADLMMSTQESPSIVEGEQGDVFIAWQDNRNNPIRKEIFVQKFNRNGDPQWLEATRTHPGTNNSRPIILRKGQMVITASYFAGELDELLLVQILNNNGNPQLEFSEGKVSENAKAIEPNQIPAVAPGLDGGVIATWTDTRFGNPAVFAKGIKNDGTAWNAGEVQVSLSIAAGTNPVIVSDNREGAIIAWLDTAGVIKAHNLDKFGNLNSQWGVNGIEVSQTQGNKRNIKIASDGRNGAYVLWEKLLGTEWKLYVQRVRIDGTVVSPSNDIRVSSSDGIQTNAAIINDGRQQAIIAWENQSNNNVDIYAQKIDSIGVVKWGGGLTVSTNEFTQRNPVLVDDGMGGAIIAWEDLRNQSTSGIDIYAQKVSAPGVVGEIRSITISSPKGGENLEIGSTQTILWEWAGEINEVVIELSDNGGISWQELIFATRENTGSRVWMVNRESGKYLLRISDLNSPFINAISDTFTISAPMGPNIQHTAVTQATRGESLPISAVVTDISRVAGVILNYGKGGAQQFVPDTMVAVSGDTFSQIIPADFVTERGVDYFISSVDNLGKTSTSDTVFVTVTFDAGVETTRISRGSSQTSYRMVSAPNLLNRTLADSIFAFSGFGVYDTTSWRLFQYRDNGYVERDSSNAITFKFEPGEAFWLISSRDRTVDFGSGVSLRADTSYTITLKPGWNQIGLPFAFPVLWDTIFGASGDPAMVQKPFLYTGSYALANVLQPYQGYFIFNRANANIKLIIPPVASATSKQSLARVNSSNAEWELQIKARSQEARDDFNLLGINQAASENWDVLDYTEPPPIGEYVSLYFPHNDWEVFPGNYTTDFRDQLGPGQTWTFTITTNIPHSEVQLTIEGVESIFQDVEVILLDERLNVSKNLRADNSYAFPTGSQGTIKTLKLVVGSSDYLSDEVSDIALVPVDFELSQNFPNPFNPGTAIRYGLPRSEKVRIRIYDLLGREVKTLIDGEQQEAGFHIITWNGQDKNGRTVASGVYIYRMEAGKFTQTRKMILVK